MRLVQLFVGLTLFGVAMAGFVRSGLGLAPWDVLHYGVTLHTGLSLGTVVIIFGFLVLLLWIPLRQMPGLGTIANVIWIGMAADIGLAIIPEAQALPAQLALFAGSLLVNGLGGGLYIGSQLGPGPRDGLMTGLHARTGISLRLARTGVEVLVLAVGWFLGGIVGFGTVLYALAIGPVTQLFLRFCIVELRPVDRAEATTTPVRQERPSARESTATRHSGRRLTRRRSGFRCIIGNVYVVTLKQRDRRVDGDLGEEMLRALSDIPAPTPFQRSGPALLRRRSRALPRTPSTAVAHGAAQPPLGGRTRRRQPVRAGAPRGAIPPGHRAGICAHGRGTLRAHR